MFLDSTFTNIIWFKYHTTAEYYYLKIENRFREAQLPARGNTSRTIAGISIEVSLAVNPQSILSFHIYTK